MPARLFILFISLLCFRVHAQKRWVGAAAGNWDDAKNWQPLGVPGIADDVVLDNLQQKNDYKVTLPDTTVNIHALLLQPATNNNIELILPASNKSSPALMLTDTANSLTIKAGAVFRNSSGLTSGQSIQVNGVITIFNGGRFIHNSRSSHATEIVARLSTMAGTEKGIIEFDVPGGSYPISFSNRIYGSVTLSSNASGGSQTYNASGTNQVTVNGDFRINEGVQFNLDLSKDMFVNADYIQTGGVFNIASQPNNNTVKIKGNINQAATGVVTESSGGLPVIELCGEVTQLVYFSGNITNSITLKVNNTHGLTLTSTLILPYKMELAAGIVKTSKTTLLTLQDNCIISGGSASSFINGPVKKTGDDDFEFPVGKQGDYAPVKMSGSGGSVNDEFIAEYFLGNPESVYGSSIENPPMVRISQLEYWVLERLSGFSGKKVGVSVGNYSNATSLKDLVLARWDVSNHLWKSEGNSYYAGIATGLLVSNEMSSFGAFTLGSTVITQNLLPLGFGKPNAFQPPAVMSRGSSFNIFPLQTTGQLNVKYQLSEDEFVTIMITDAGGRRVKIMKLNLSKGSGHDVIYLHDLSMGVYFLSVYYKNGRFWGVQKILKTN